MRDTKVIGVVLLDICDEVYFVIVSPNFVAIYYAARVV